MEINDVSSELKTSGSIDVILRRGPLLAADPVRDVCGTPAPFILLLSGLPGAGKTTVGLYLLNWLHRRRPGLATRRPLLLSLVENGEQLGTLCEAFGFDFQGRAPILPVRVKDDDEPQLARLAAAVGLDLEPGGLLFVDGISVLGTDARHRAVLRQFIDQIRAARLHAILVAEEYSPYGDTYLEYAVDGIIRLTVDSTLTSTRGLAPRRRLEVTKLRWHDYSLGAHAFRLNSLPKDAEPSRHEGVKFFPSAACLIGARSERPVAADRTSGLRSGVPGFDEMVTAEGGPFRVGEHVLLLGPSGSGTFQFGAQFLQAAAEDERPLFVSFARPIDGVREAFERLPPAKAGPCSALHVDVTRMALEEVLGALHDLLETHEPAVTRLFVHGLATLRHRFEDDPQYEAFVRSLLALVQTFPNVTALVSYSTPRVFASYAEIDIPVSDRFSTIVSFNFQEQYNRIERGIVILKSRAATYDSSLKVPLIKNGLYAIDSKAGWARVALLSGDRERVHEERPFVKLFYENKSEQEVLTGPFDDFKDRYPDSTQFQMVGKHNPQPGHWSFRGYFGPGHSNTKLVQLRKYVMDELRDDQLLLDVPSELIKFLRIGQPDYFDEGSFLWRDCTAPAAPSAPSATSGTRGEDDGEETTQMLPAYADVGVLVYQKPSLAFPYPIPETWDEMADRAVSFEGDGDHQHLFIIPNTVGDYRNFVSFFFELCWTHGWKFPGDGYCATHADARDQLIAWVDGDPFNWTMELLERLVKKGAPEAIPNPRRGGHYHQSVFSRRWFSKIHLLPSDAMHRSESAPGFNFGIAPLPGVRRGLSYGVSSVDLYALGVIRGALAPETAWMLVTSLFERDLDTSRAKSKRGLPISRTKFNTKLVQDNLNAEPPAPPKAPKFYEASRDLFKEYAMTLRTILGEEGSGSRVRRFRRTSDIPRYFHVEQCLARHLPRMFEDPPVSWERIRSDIKSDIEQNVYPARTPITTAGKQ